MIASKQNRIVAAKVTVIAAAVPLMLWAYAGGPDPRHTGAPGDQTCAKAGCHTGNLNTGAGSAAITFPSGLTYVPGQKQRWTITVTHPGAQVYGFQATARLASNESGAQAGAFTDVDTSTQILCDDGSVKQPSCRAGATVEFIQHSAASRTGTWTVEWTPPATDAGPVKIYLAGNGANGNRTNSGDSIYTANFTLTPASSGGGGGGARPTINSGGVIDVWTAQPGVAPFTWTSIYGANFATAAKSWDDAIQGDLLPTSLDGVSVMIDNKPATISYVSRDLINVLVPGNVTAGDVSLVVRNAAGESAPFTVRSTAFKPTFYVYPQNPQSGRIYHTAVTGTAASPVYVGKTGTDPRVTRGARPGETLQVYGTGFGPTTPPVTAATLFSGAPAVSTPIRIRFGTTNATVVNGNGNLVAPGLYLFNVTVPTTLADGEYPLIAEIGGISSSAAVYVVVQR